MQLVKLPKSKLLQFKTDMKYAFRKGSAEGLGIDEAKRKYLEKKSSLLRCLWCVFGVGRVFCNLLFLFKERRLIIAYALPISNNWFCI